MNRFETAKVIIDCQKQKTYDVEDIVTIKYHNGGGCGGCQFENRNEIRELLKVADKIVKQKPDERNNRTLVRFIDLLNMIDMEW